MAHHHLPFAGTISVRKELLVELLLEHARSFERHGFETLFLYPSHGGNFPAVTEAAARARQEVPGILVVAYDDAEAYLGAMRRVTDQLGVSKEVAGGHSGQMEASMVTALRPELVRTEAAAPGYMGNPDRLPPVSQEGYDKITPNGSIGDPRGATKAKGDAYLDALAAELTRGFRAQMHSGPIQGVWSYRTISARGHEGPLTGLFIFDDGRFVQSTIHEGTPPEAQLGQGHVGRYLVDGNRLTLDVSLQLVVDPTAEQPLSFSTSAKHESTFTVDDKTLTIRFPSGTVQVFDRIPARAPVPQAQPRFYEMTELTENGRQRKIEGGWMFSNGRFAYATYAPGSGSEAGEATPSWYASAEGSYVLHGEEIELEVERTFEGERISYGTETTARGSFAINEDRSEAIIHLEDRSFRLVPRE